MSSLREFYEAIDLEAVTEFVRERRQEDLSLDFKVLGGSANFGRDDRKNFARAVSGFANSDGGVLVWGVNARKDEDGVDAAIELVPIENVSLAVSKLNALTGKATSPFVDGVTHRAIPQEGESGFVVTYVPQVDTGPHMAKLGEDRYYKRSGDSFYKMEHFDIADMFGRRRRPKLSFLIDAQKGPERHGSGGTIYEVEIVLGIRNTGRAIARFPLLTLSLSNPYTVSGVDGPGNFGLPWRTTYDLSRQSFGGGADDVVHIGADLPVAITRTDVRKANMVAAPLTVQYRIAAQDVPPFEDEYTISGKEIIRSAFDF